MRELKFYKESSNKWYVDLPEWEGPKSDLEMIYGADTMLDYLSENKNEVILNVSETEFDNSDILHFKEETPDIGEGSYYILHSYKGIDMDSNVWLCDVAKFFFGYFPKQIYFSLVTN